MTTALAVKAGEVWCEQSPIYAAEGEKRYVTVTFLDVTTISSPSVKAYANKRDVTSVVLPTNSPTAATNVVTLSPIFNMTGGNRYVVAVTATADGADILIAKFEMICQRAKMEQ
jgi:hypothetical protein